jgi:hypothetical protein
LAGGSDAVVDFDVCLMGESSTTAEVAPGMRSADDECSKVRMRLFMFVVVSRLASPASTLSVAGVSAISSMFYRFDANTLFLALGNLGKAARGLPILCPVFQPPIFVEIFPGKQLKGFKTTINSMLDDFIN